MSVNKVILIGNLGKDPEVRYFDEKTAKASFTLATSETYTNKEGQKVTNTEWHNIVVWRGLAKVVEQYVKKGHKLYIEGKLTHRSWDDDKGQKHYFTEVVANSIEMLTPKGSNGEASQYQQETSQPASKVTEQQAPPINTAPQEDDDLPF